MRCSILSKRPAVKRLKRFFVFAFIFSISVFAILIFNNRILPKAIEISLFEAQNVSNTCINTAVMSVIDETGVSASDFFGSTDSDINGFSINTVLINELCSKISIELNEEIKSINDRKIKIPIGAASDMGIFSNVGPDIGFKLLEHGTSYVDYETSFEEAGINQTNFKVWLNVSVNVKIVNPLVSRDINVQRKIMLVNTVIKGDTPEGYFNISR